MRFFASKLALVFSVVSAALLSSCAKTKKVGVATSPEALAAANPSPATQGESTCLPPEKVFAGLGYTCGDGKARKGSMPPGNVSECKKDGEVACLSTATFPAVEKALLKKGVIKAGFTVAGIVGGYPSAEYPLAGVTPGVPASCGSDGESGCVTSASFPAADAAGLANKVISTATVAGVTGNVSLPASADVKMGVQFGLASGTGSTGSYTGAVPCVSDGDKNCNIPNSGSIAAADTSNFTGWDIRKKRNESTGAVLTFAGLAGQSKTCRNRANNSVWNNIPAGPAPTHSDLSNSGLDTLDTIDDYNNNLTGLPGQIPAWSIINSVDLGLDYVCGGIYATGEATLGNAADGTPHDANGNWKDLTPGIIPAAMSDGQHEPGPRLQLCRQALRF